jgi:hypothetical protein
MALDQMRHQATGPSRTTFAQVGGQDLLCQA